MVQRTTLTVAIVFLVCLLWAGPALAAKSYSAERFDAVLDVQPDGSLVVTETVRFRFVGGPFTYAFRDLAYTQIDEIDRLQASMDGEALPQGTGAGQVEVVADRPLKVTWHFAPTSDSVHEFVLTYRVQGAIRREAGADTLIWRAIPEDHDYDIERGTITLRYPASVPLVGPPGLSGAVAEPVAVDGQIQWAVAGIGADESLVVTARFSPGSLVQAPPEWQVREAGRQQQTARELRAALAGGLATLALGLGALGAFLARRRTRVADRPEVMRAGTPPGDIPAGMAVQLVGRGTPALATLFDLAARGLLSIEESGKGFLGGKKYSLERLPAARELRPHEEGLLSALFAGGVMGDSLPLSEVAGRLARHSKRYREPLKQEMKDAGLLDPWRQAAHDRLVLTGVVAVLVGAAALVAGAIVAGLASARGAGPVATAGAAAAGVGGAAILVGLATLIAGAVFSPLSERGEQVAAAWKGFGAYLKDIVRGREFVSGEALFERYLPLAAGLGLGEQWAKHFQKQGYTQIPAWFRALDAETGDFAAIVALMAATNASASSGDAGAAGASGGGASGAG
jgi:hypothetical protein